MTKGAGDDSAGTMLSRISDSVVSPNPPERHDGGEGVIVAGHVGYFDAVTVEEPRLLVRIFSRLLFDPVRTIRFQSERWLSGSTPLHTRSLQRIRRTTFSE